MRYIENLRDKKLKWSLSGLISGVTLFTSMVTYADSYTVQSGDTLSAIAKQYDTTIEELAQKNHIGNIDVIYVGQTLEVGGETTSTNTTVVEANSNQTSISATTSTLSAADAEAKEWIAQKESSGNYAAQNGQYYGRYQLTISYLNGDLSPENQEKVADAYVANRYGSWSAAKNFWLANGWY